MTGLSHRAGERGQLLLVAAILMAVVIVGTVVLLNGIQFVENTGSGDSLRESKSVDQSVAELRPGLQDVLVGAGNESGPFVTDSSGGIVAYRENVSDFMDVYGNLTGYGTAALVDATVNESESVNGTVLGQANGTFENTTGSGDWTMVEGLDDSPRSELTFLHMNLTSQSADSSANFSVRFVNASGGARLNLSFTETTAFVDRPAESLRQLCPDTLEDNATEVTVSHGGIRFSGNGTDDCDVVALSSDAATSTPLERVEIRNGSQANGSFVATVGRDGTSVPTGTPELAPNALINPAVDVRYDSAGISYTSTIFVMGRTN